MKELISLDKMLENIKSKNENSKRTIESAENTIKIINKIEKARIDLGMTQRDLADKCGIKQPALARIETCKVIPKLNTIISIAKAVGVEIIAVTTSERQYIEGMQQMYNFISTNNFSYNTNSGEYLWQLN